DRRHIEQDLLRTMAWECGHRCGHPNSSNWRTWALAILASCGFAIGDRQLMEEAINGAWDEERGLYLYGVVQQLTHSIFSDGIHWERSIGYTYYTGSALMYVMVAAKNSGVDLWHAKLPGILGPFQGSAPHEEYGPPGDRSIRAFLDAPFYYAFANGAFPKVNDSNTGALSYHPIYELAWREYADPRYAWLIHRERSQRATDAPGGWNLWRPAGNPRGELVPGAGPQGSPAFRIQCAAGDRAALVQRFTAPAHVAVTVRAWAKPVRLQGGKVHLRANVGEDAYYSPDARAADAWQQLSVEIPPRAGARAGDQQSVGLHLFLEGGAGEVLWAQVQAVAQNDAANLVTNGDFTAQTGDGRTVDFWSLVHSPKDVPEGHYSLDDDATIGLTGKHVNGCTLFPIGGFAILRHKPVRPEGTSINLTYGPYGSGHDHPDRLHFDLYGLG
ncbi:MAG: alginate lyase family protein, partial [Armatimonadota bacterium]|nr:alginate lyase family protein [Armatimonadota bacterium]